jgi:uncharacterized membrane protein YphA (DoxX/SURF4 family)
LDNLNLNLFEIALVLFSGVSFLVYGISFFISERMKKEFERFELSRFANLIGVLELMGGIGLLIGLKVNVILLIASGGLGLLMLLGFGVRLKMKDGFFLSFPSLFFMIVNFYIFLTASNLF